MYTLVCWANISQLADAQRWGCMEEWEIVPAILNVGASLLGTITWDTNYKWFDSFQESDQMMLMMILGLAYGR